ncbi:hypothetical protein [Corallibacter sp.]|uniref:hypothetical protein n=1 Tax=Corallibacter sp. TaxID=2038084 RepID=UPI003AB4EF35
MNLNKKHIDFENRFQYLLGLTIQKVEYLEIKYDDKNSKPYYNSHFKEIDTIDFSIIFQTEKDKIEIYWDGEFYEYGIGIRINQKTEIATGQKWDVSKSELWKKFIGQKISDFKISWDEVITIEQNSKKTNKFIYPQDLRINFMNNKSIFISAAGFIEIGDNVVMGRLDNLTVTDNELLARQVKMID